MLTNLHLRDRILAAIRAAAPKAYTRKPPSVRFITDASQSVWLRPGERAVGIGGGLRALAVYSPAGVRDGATTARLLIFDARGNVAHEEESTLSEFKRLTAT